MEASACCKARAFCESLWFDVHPMDTISPLLSPSSSERTVTLRNIAESVGVSVQSVSGVLNEGGIPKRVSPQTRQRILAAAEELGYRRNQGARAMRTGNTRMLGWLGGNLREEHVGKMLEGALEATDACGYTLKILRLGDIGNAQQVIRRSSELRLMGVLALHLPVTTQTELNAEAKSYGYPLVLMDAPSDRTDIPQVVSDDEGGICEGVRHLVELGHRRIAFVSAEADNASLGRNRERAFQAAMASHRLEVPSGFITHGSFSARDPSFQAAHALLCLPPQRRPTAIFCAGDFIALATLQAAQEQGIDVPRQLSIIGFANLSVLDFVTPRLTSIEQPFVEIGRQAVHLLLNVVEAQEKEHGGRPGASTDASKMRLAFQEPLRLQTRLIQRASTAPPPLECATPTS